MIGSVSNSRDYETYRLKIISYVKKRPRKVSESIMIPSKGLFIYSRQASCQENDLRAFFLALIDRWRVPRPNRKTRSYSHGHERACLFMQFYEIRTPGIINSHLFQSISYPRNSFLMTFQISRRITKGHVTLKILLAHVRAFDRLQRKKQRKMCDRQSIIHRSWHTRDAHDYFSIK